MTDNIPPVKLLIILDNEVVEVLNTDERLAAMLTSEPIILAYEASMGERPERGDLWDGKNLTKPTVSG
jgi:hypothetical protein